MNNIQRPVRSTILFGLFCSIGFLPAMAALPLWIPRQLAFLVLGWCCLGIYSLMLCRWGGKSVNVILFPLLMTAAVIFLGNWITAYPILLATFCWIRSGICMQQTPFKGFIKELSIGFGGGLLLYHLDPHSLFGRSLSIWLFFLLQSLYFLFPIGARSLEKPAPQPDPFEQSRQQAEQILGG